MTLEQWMADNQLDDVAFGKLVRRNRSQIYRIRKGHSRPSDKLKDTIARVTKGEVPVDVWFAPLPRKKAA